MEPDSEPKPFKKFEDLLRRLSHISKKEVDELEESRMAPSDSEQADDEQAQDRE